ncbi:MAG: hypothetical protein NE334_18535 [Lentisphaeraceae bacterium]|nr:hypothetical protein [Lentisphaeraceae bacterium]
MKAKLITLLAIIGMVTTNYAEEKNFDDFISPASNPVYFESPFHETSLRLIHIHQEFHSKVQTDVSGPKLKLDGELTATALQLRYAVNERFSIIATKDGYARMHYDNTLESEDGFLDLALGVKWSPYIDYENQAILTLGLRVEVPTGDRNVFQGGNSVIFNPFLSFAKGFENLHIMGYQGFQLPANTNQSSTISHTSLHIDYKIGNFYPLIELNWRHVLSSGNGGPYDAELKGGATLDVNTIQSQLDAVDIANLGTANSEGQNYVNWAFGFRYKISDNLTAGFAYETPLSHDDNGIFGERYTFDLIYSF